MDDIDCEEPVELLSAKPTRQTSGGKRRRHDSEDDMALDDDGRMVIEDDDAVALDRKLTRQDVAEYMQQLTTEDHYKASIESPDSATRMPNGRLKFSNKRAK